MAEEKKLAKKSGGKKRVKRSGKKNDRGEDIFMVEDHDSPEEDIHDEIDMEEINRQIAALDE